MHLASWENIRAHLSIWINNFSTISNLRLESHGKKCTSVFSTSLPSCCWTQIFMLHINTLYYSLHVVPQGCILFWPFDILHEDHKCLLLLSLYFSSLLHYSSLLHLTAEIIHGYVWKHSCAFLIPRLIPPSQKTTFLTTSLWQEWCISHFPTHTAGTCIMATQCIHKLLKEAIIDIDFYPAFSPRSVSTSQTHSASRPQFSLARVLF